MAGAIVAIVVVIFLVILFARTIRIVPQAKAGIVERFGRYHRTLNPGLTVLMPFVDRLKPLIDLREQVVSFPPQPVITEDNLVVGIDTVLYFTVNDAKSVDLRGGQPAAGDRADHGHDAAQRDRLADARAGADQPRPHQRPAAHASSTRPPTSGGSASTGSRSSRSTRRARSRRRWRSRCGPSATGAPRSSTPRASSSPRSSPPRARSRPRCSPPKGQKQAAILKAEGEAQAIATVFKAIHDGEPDQKLLSYQYLQMLPQLAQGDANKVFVIPSEFADAFGGISRAFSAGRRGEPSRRRRGRQAGRRAQPPQRQLGARRISSLVTTSRCSTP